MNKNSEIPDTEFKKETRKLQVEVEIKDKKSNQTIKLTKEEEIELRYVVKTTVMDIGTRQFPGRKKIIQIDKDGKEYNLLLEGEVKKGWFKDTPLGMTIKPMSDDFEIINQKVVFPQWRKGGFIAIGITLLLLIGGAVGFYFWRKRKT